MRMCFSTGLLAAMSVVWLGGCASYQAAPFEPARHAEAWDERAKALGATLSSADAERLALLFNPDLRQTRAEAGVQAAGIRGAGLPDDPALSLGLGRRLGSAASPWLVEGGLSVALPLSDRLQAEKANAACAWTAAEAQVLAKEAEVVRQVREAFAHWHGAQAQGRAWQAQVGRLESLHRRLQKLAASGSVPAYEADAVALALTQARANQTGTAAQAAGERLHVLALCGLRPACPVPLSMAVQVPASIPRPGFVHPARQAAQAAFDQAEGALRLEVARSRPELAFGPTGKREDGATTWGLGLGLSLPIWNRNQRAIAQAAAARESARVHLEQTIEALAHGRAEAQVKADGAAARLRIIQRDAGPLLARQTESLEHLTKLGEFDPLRLLALFELRLQWELSLAQMRADAAQAQAQLAYFTEPWPVAPPRQTGAAAARESLLGKPAPRAPAPKGP